MEYINNYNEKCQYKNIRIHNKLKKNSQNVKETLTFSDCRQSPGICRDFYYEHCFSGIIELSERRCFL